MQHDEEAQLQAPSSPVAFGDPTLDRDALSDEERRAVGPRRLSSAEWVMVAAFAASVAGTGFAALASKGPPLAVEVERPRVREAVLRHQFAEARRFVDVSSSVFCVALFGGIDPTDELLAAFAQETPRVLPVSRCHRGDDAARDQRAWLFSVGTVEWRWSGEAFVVAGARSPTRYTLRRHEGEWRVLRAEPLR